MKTFSNTIIAITVSAFSLFSFSCGMKPNSSEVAQASKSCISNESAVSRLKDKEIDLAFEKTGHRAQILWSTTPKVGVKNCLSIMLFNSDRRDLEEPWQVIQPKVEMVRARSCCGHEKIFKNAALSISEPYHYEKRELQVDFPGNWTFTFVLRGSNNEILDQQEYTIRID